MTEAIITTSVAVIIFCGTQLFAILNSRNHYLKTKLEEYYMALHTIIEKARIVYRDDRRPEFPGIISQQASELALSLQRPKMLATIYFPDTTPRFERVLQRAKAYNQLMHDIINQEVSLGSKEESEGFDGLVADITELWNYLEEEYPSLTKSLNAASAYKIPDMH